MPDFNLTPETQAAISSDSLTTFEQFLNSHPRVADLSHLVPYILDRARQFPDKNNVYADMINALIKICPVINVNHTFDYPFIEDVTVRFTPLMYAARFDLHHIVAFLLAQPGINIMAQLPSKQTAFEMAPKNSASWKLLRQAHIQQFSREAFYTDSNSLESILDKYKAINIQPLEVAHSIVQETKTEATINTLILSLSYNTAAGKFLDKNALLAELKKEKLKLVGHHGTIDQLTDEQMKNRFTK